MRGLLPSLLALLLAAPQAAAAGPSNPFVHKNVCPFECCTYRDWTTNKATTLVDRPNGTAKIVTIASRTVVAALTGDVYSVPRRMVAAHAYPYSPIRKGDEFYALHYTGEGFWSVWYKGKLYDIELLDDVGETDHSAWWVRIRTKDGKSGWVLNNGQFDNADACG